jgi:hypothetical protein
LANLLKMTVVQSILSLHAQCWSRRRIATALGIDRGTVGRHIRQASRAAQPDSAESSKPAVAPIDSARVGADSKAAIAPAGAPAAIPPAESALGRAESVVAGRQSNAEPWRGVILAKHQQGLSAKRIHQDLQSESGVAEVSYDSVRRLLRRFGAVRPLPMRRMECEPGQEVQVDFGTGARIKTAEDFLRVLENAFWHFGGVPKTVVVDNLKAAVLRPDRFDPDLNPKLQSFARYYGTVILPTKPRMPRHKGKVERGIPSRRSTRPAERRSPTARSDFRRFGSFSSDAALTNNRFRFSMSTRSFVPCPTTVVGSATPWPAPGGGTGRTPGFLPRPPNLLPLFSVPCVLMFLNPSGDL